MVTGKLSVKLLQDQELNYESDDKNYNILVYAKDEGGFGGLSSGKIKAALFQHRIWFPNPYDHTM